LFASSAMGLVVQLAMLALLLSLLVHDPRHTGALA
jgi:hypothetical protein